MFNTFFSSSVVEAAMKLIAVLDVLTKRSPLLLEQNCLKELNRCLYFIPFNQVVTASVTK